MERRIEGGWLLCAMHAPSMILAIPLFVAPVLSLMVPPSIVYGQLQQKREEEMKSTEIVSYLLLITCGCYVSHDALDFHVCPTFGQEVFD